MNPPLTYLRRGEADYPAQLTACLGAQAPATITLRGNRDLWFQRARPLLALFCSTKAPASVILRVHDLAQQWRAAGVTVIGGFHSPAEQEVLVILLRGPGAVLVCPARSILGMRVKPEYKESLAAALADQVLIAYAEPGGKTDQLAQEVVTWGKPLYMLDNPANENLLTLNADAFENATVPREEKQCKEVGK